MSVEIGFKDKYTIDKEKKENKTRIKNCYFPWSCINIGALGELSPCCRRRDLVRLKTYQEDFLDVWNTIKFKKIRQTVNTSKPMHECLVCNIKTDELTTNALNQLVDNNTPLFRKIIKNKKLRSNLSFLHKILPKRLLKALGAKTWLD